VKVAGCRLGVGADFYGPFLAGLGPAGALLQWGLFLVWSPPAPPAQPETRKSPSFRSPRTSVRATVGAPELVTPAALAGYVAICCRLGGRGAAMANRGGTAAHLPARCSNRELRPTVVHGRSYDAPSRPDPESLGHYEGRLYETTK
jgi:hypothetical protein